VKFIMRKIIDCSESEVSDGAHPRARNSMRYRTLLCL